MFFGEGNQKFPSKFKTQLLEEPFMLNSSDIEEEEAPFNYTPFDPQNLRVFVEGFVFSDLKIFQMLQVFGLVFFWNEVKENGKMTKIQPMGCSWKCL